MKRKIDGSYQTTKKNVFEKTISGPDQQRVAIPGYETTDMVDRLSNVNFYKKRMMSPVKKVTKVRTKEDDAELNFEYEEGDLQVELKDIQKKFTRLTTQAKLDLKKHFRKMK